MCGKNIRLESMFHLGGGELHHQSPLLKMYVQCDSFLKMYQIGLHSLIAVWISIWHPI